MGMYRRQTLPRLLLPRFLEDWGPQKNPASLTVKKSRHCTNGIHLTIAFPQGDDVWLWVNRGDQTLSLAPWEICDFRFKAPRPASK